MSMTVYKDTTFQAKWIFRKGTDVTGITEDAFNISIIDANNNITHYRDTEYTFTYLAPTSTTDGYLVSSDITPLVEGIMTIYLNLDNPANNKQSNTISSISVYVATHTNVIEQYL